MKVSALPIFGKNLKNAKNGGGKIFFAHYSLFIICCAIDASSDGFLTPDSTLEVAFAVRFAF